MRIFFVGLFVFGVVGFLWWCAPQYVDSKLPPDADTKASTRLGRAGQYGDQFGAFTALISALGFAGVIISLFVQEAHHKEQMNGLNKQLAQERFSKAIGNLPVWEMVIDDDHVVVPDTNGHLFALPHQYKITLRNLGAPVFAVYIVCKKSGGRTAEQSRFDNGPSIELKVDYQKLSQHPVIRDQLTILYISQLGERLGSELFFSTERRGPFLSDFRAEVEEARGRCNA